MTPAAYDIHVTANVSGSFKKVTPVRALKWKPCRTFSYASTVSLDHRTTLKSHSGSARETLSCSQNTRSTMDPRSASPCRTFQSGSAREILFCSKNVRSTVDPRSASPCRTCVQFLQILLQLRQNSVELGLRFLSHIACESKRPDPNTFRHRAQVNSSVSPRRVEKPRLLQAVQMSFSRFP